MSAGSRLFNYMQTKEQKKELVKKLAEKLKTSKAVVFSDYKGLSVKDMSKLRRELCSEGVDFQVLKKTLINIAIKDADLDVDVRKMEGQIALAISQGDEVAAAKIIAGLAKSNENIKIISGILGQEVISAEKVVALSKLPSKEELLAKLVGSINAPVSGFVNVLAGNLRGLVNVLNAINEVKQ